MRGFIAAALASLLLLTLVMPAHAGIADQVGATFGLMLQDVVNAFPPVEGVVVQVDGERLYMDLAKKHGVLLGQEFSVFRKGEVFRHPFSGKVIGRYEEILGYAQVQRVEEGFSEALFVPIEGKDKPKPTDGVRITRGRIKVAVALEVMGWVIPVLLERRGVTYLDITWVSAVTGTALFSRRMAITRADGASEQRFPWEPRPED